MNVLRLDDLDIYKLAIEIGQDVWKIVNEWETFAKRTLGVQFVNAADSISANIAEGFGRFFYKDRKIFCYYSRGSLLETKNWALKSFQRSLMNQIEYDLLINKLQVLHHQLNLFIKKLKINSVT